jgi:uncharacterized protein YdhG (YjbR/CyaY superfamily)
MQSKVTNVMDYLTEIPQERKERLTALRQLCRDILKGYEECMDYGMPTYKKDGKVEVAFASQKNYIALYILKPEVVEANKALLKGLSVGKSCIRFTKPETTDLGIVEKLLTGTVNSPDQAC